MPRTSTKPTVKKSTVKPKKVITKKVVKTMAQPTAVPQDAMRSFRLSKPQEPFLSLQFTRQTLYWSIIAFMVVGLAAWVLYLQLQIIDIYDSIERSQLLEE